MDLPYLKSIIKYLLTACLSLLIIIYIVYHLAGGFQTEIETTPATLETIKSNITAEVTILRQETLLYAPMKGDVNYLYYDGDKVAIHTPVAEVYPMTGNEETRRRIMEIDRLIRLLEESNMSDAEKRTDTASTDALIRDHLYDIVDAVEDGNISHAAETANDFLIQLNRRRIITKHTSSYNAKIEMLRAEKAALSSGLVSAEHTVTTETPGYFYTSLDGYETVYAAGDIDRLTYREYLAMTEKAPDDYSGEDGQYPVGKLVTDYLWYVACEVNADELHNYEVGKTYSIKFPYSNDTTLSMTLYRILSDIGSDTAVLLFRTGMLPEDFSYLRHQTVQIEQNAYTGYRVPISAVRMINGQPGVYVLSGSKVVFRYIKPLYEADGYLIVAERDDAWENYTKYLNKNDFIITKGKELYDGKIVG